MRYPDVGGDILPMLLMMPRDASTGQLAANTAGFGGTAGVTPWDRIGRKAAVLPARPPK
jgi:hypothetical protein